MSDQPSKSYTVVFSLAQFAELNRLRERAAAVRMEVSFLLDLQTIRDRLTTNPTAWGDPAYPLRNLDLTMYRGVEGMLLIYFAVNEVRRIVYPSTITYVRRRVVDPGEMKYVGSSIRPPSHLCPTTRSDRWTDL